jgi:hypothetical protein
MPNLFLSRSLEQRTRDDANKKTVAQHRQDAPGRFLEIGILDLFGIWDLGFGISSFHLVVAAGHVAKGLGGQR